MYGQFEQCLTKIPQNFIHNFPFLGLVFFHIDAFLALRVKVNEKRKKGRDGTGEDIPKIFLIKLYEISSPFSTLGRYIGAGPSFRHWQL